MPAGWPGGVCVPLWLLPLLLLLGCYCQQAAAMSCMEVGLCSVGQLKPFSADIRGSESGLGGRRGGRHR